MRAKQRIRTEVATEQARREALVQSFAKPKRQVARTAHGHWHNVPPYGEVYVDAYSHVWTARADSPMPQWLGQEQDGKHYGGAA